MNLYNFLENEVEKNIYIKREEEGFKNKKILITGATGLLGSMICMTLSCMAVKQKINIKIVAMVRSIKKAEEILREAIQNGNTFLLEQDIISPIEMEEEVDYIIHTACPTASNTFIEKPVETIKTIVVGTENILHFARTCNCKSVVYFSSMEAYGQILHENPLKPEDVGYINPLNLRSCYSEGKRMAENLCMAYNKEYAVPVKIIRFAQTFGPGISKNDKRVFAQFIHSAIEGKNIIMYTEGTAKRMYLDTVDAINACIVILMHGKNGQVYNAGNPSTYCSIKEMAEMVAKNFGNDECQVIIDTSRDVGQYPPANKLFLDVQPLKELGWSPKYNLEEMYKRMLILI